MIYERHILGENPHSILWLLKSSIHKGSIHMHYTHFNVKDQMILVKPFKESHFKMCPEHYYLNHVNRLDTFDIHRNALLNCSRARVSEKYV